MTNQERAEEIILGRTATDAAQALADAGLLMPDSPTPDEEEWEYGVQSREYSEYAKMWSGWGHFAIPFEKQRTRESCEQFIKGRQQDSRFEYRLVRRRVSPVEVVDD